MDAKEIGRGLQIEDDGLFAIVTRKLAGARLLRRASHLCRRVFWNSRSLSRNDASIAGTRSATGSALP